MDFLASTAAGKAVDHFSSKFSDCIKNFKGQHDDIALADAIRQELLDQYGNEPFYNDFDSYLICNTTIDSLILTLRNSSPQPVMGPSEFVGKNFKQLLDTAPSCLAYSAQIKDALLRVFDCAYFAITDINPYSDFGRLQSDIRIQNAENNAQMQDGFARICNMVERIENHFQLLQNETASQNLPDFSAEAEIFKAKIKEIEKIYQHQSRFDEALTQYGNLALSIAEAEIRGDAKSTLLCALRCNIALCHSNLGNAKEAMESLDKIPINIAQSNETYNYVWASVVIQNKLEDQYPEALNRAESALRLKPDYHRAFFFRQHLLAMLGMKSQQELIDELDSYFSKISDEGQKKELLGDYYAFRGLICTAFNDSTSAYENYEKAASHGYNEFVSQFNMLSALYGQAVKNVPYGQRFIHPNVDILKLYKVLDGLKILLQDKHMSEKAYKDVKCYAVSLYVSASVTIKGSHDLQPLQLYLPLSKDYETTRMLILGSTEQLTPDTVQLLEENDQFLLEIRQLLHNDDLQKCREKIEERLEDPDYSLPADTALTLLQLCIVSKDLESYHKYRNMEGIEAFAGDSLVAMDACACELEGDIEKAKLLFWNITQSCTDYHVLENVLRFYKRSNCVQDCEALYFKLQSLQKEQKTYIDDLDGFYCSGLDFMILQKRNSAKDFFESVPKDAISTEAYSYMEERLYQAINDPLHLCIALSRKPNARFQDKVNQAICHRLMCRYDDSLNLCLDLVRNAKGISDEQLVKVYWLISDSYLFKKMPKESYSWALKAHKLMERHPYDQSHRAFLGRIMRSGHFEGLSIILEYQDVHPVVVNYFKAIQVSPDDKDMPQKFLQQVKEYLPDTPDYADRERRLALDYKNLPMPIHMLLQYFNEDWGHVLSFAQKNKLRLGTGDSQRQQLEESWVCNDIVVDAQTLIIMAACGCLPSLQMMEHVHISYSSIAILQYCYLSNNFGLIFIEELMDWVNSEKTVVLEPDGMIDINDTFVQALSKDFFIGCNIAERFNIPFLCADILAVFLQNFSDSPISKDVRFITLPVLCKVFGRNQPDLSSQMLYNLMKYGEFISFSASTVFEQIKSHNFQVSDEILHPFLICKSDYNMQSFSGVYLSAIYMLKEENETSAIDLSKTILSNTMQIWRRGTYYRESLKKMPNDSIVLARALSILKYTCSIIVGMEQIWTTMPKQIRNLCDELREVVADELT